MSSKELNLDNLTKNNTQVKKRYFIIYKSNSTDKKLLSNWVYASSDYSLLCIFYTAFSVTKTFLHEDLEYDTRKTSVQHRINTFQTVMFTKKSSLQVWFSIPTSGFSSTISCFPLFLFFPAFLGCFGDKLLHIHLIPHQESF